MALLCVESVTAILESKSLLTWVLDNDDDYDYGCFSFGEICQCDALNQGTMIACP